MVRSVEEITEVFNFRMPQHLEDFLKSALSNIEIRVLRAMAVVFLLDRLIAHEDLPTLPLNREGWTNKARTAILGDIPQRMLYGRSAAIMEGLVACDLIIEGIRHRHFHDERIFRLNLDNPLIAAYAQQYLQCFQEI